MFSIELGFRKVLVLVKVITGVSDAELNKFDVAEGSLYERVTVEVVRTVCV